MRSIQIVAVAAFMLFGMAAATGASQASQQPRGFSLEPGMDRPGNDLGSVAVSRGDVAACEAICAANSQCNAYTLYSPANDSASYCWYKHTAGVAHPALESVSGVRQAAQPGGVPETAGPIPLADGRALYVPVNVTGCSRAVGENLGSGVRITYNCASMGNAVVEVLIALPPLAQSPQAVLEEHAVGWQPNFMSLPASQRAELIQVETRQLASGTAAFRCMTYDNVANLNGSSHCILDTPMAEVVIACDANMARDAHAAVTVVLRRMSLS